LAGYLWKNRSLQRSTEQLIYIAGIVLFNLAIGMSKDTPIDNTGHIGENLRITHATNLPSQYNNFTLLSQRESSVAHQATKLSSLT